MKLVINYDLLEKINSANGVLNLQRIMIKEMKIQSIFYGALSGLDLLIPGNDGVQWGTNLTICSTWFVLKVVLSSILELQIKDKTEFAAYLELVKLSIQLGNSNINTSPELLKESELIKTEYKSIYKKLRFTVQQNKYILLPTYDGMGDIKDTSILQEHEIGSKEYILSIGSPSRKFVFAHSYN